MQAAGQRRQADSYSTDDFCLHRLGARNQESRRGRVERPTRGAVCATTTELRSVSSTMLARTRNPQRRVQNSLGRTKAYSWDNGEELFQEPDRRQAGSQEKVVEPVPEQPAESTLNGVYQCRRLLHWALPTKGLEESWYVEIVHHATFL